MEFIGDLISTIVRAPFICIGWIIIGIVAGALARTFMGSPNRLWINDMILGFLGAIAGGLIAGLFGLYRPEAGLPLFLANIVVATIGAMLLIALGRVLRRA